MFLKKLWLLFPSVFFCFLILCRILTFLTGPSVRYRAFLSDISGLVHTFAIFINDNRKENSKHGSPVV